MSRENVELVRSICAAWERGDFASVDWAHQEIEYVIADGPDPARFTGLAGMAEAFAVLVSAEDFRVEGEEYRALDDERVLVDPGERGAPVHVGAGKVTRLVFYFDRECALADLAIASKNDPRE